MEVESEPKLLIISVVIQQSSINSIIINKLWYLGKYYDKKKLFNPEKQISNDKINDNFDPEKVVKLIFKNQNGITYADIEVGNHVYTVETESDILESVIIQASLLSEKHISKQYVDQLIDNIRIRALFSTTFRKVGIRVLIFNETLYVNYGGKNELFMISKDGIKAIISRKVRFGYLKYLKKLAYKKGIKPNLSLLYKHIPIKDEGQKLLMIAWMVDAYLVDTSYPILLITGPTGCGKSTLSKIIQDIIDPTQLGLLAPPSSPKDMVLGVIHSHLIAYNNVTKFSEEQQNLLCIISTGGNIPDRILYTNNNLTVTELCRPVMINGLYIPFSQDDVLNRTLHISLPKLSHEDYAKSGGDKNLKNNFQHDLAQITKGFLKLVQQVFAIRDEIKLPDKLPRMSDFAIHGMAVEKVLGLAPGTFLKAYEDNLQEGLTMIIDNSGVAQTLISLTKEETFPTTYTINELLFKLREFNDNNVKLPTSARGLSQELRRIDKALAETQGIHLNYLPRSKDGYRVEVTTEI